MPTLTEMLCMCVNNVCACVYDVCVISFHIIAVLLTIDSSRSFIFRYNKSCLCECGLLIEYFKHKS